MRHWHKQQAKGAPKKGGLFWWPHEPDSPEAKWHTWMARLYKDHTGYCNKSAEACEYYGEDIVGPACTTQARQVDALRTCSFLTDDAARRQCLDKAGWKSDY